MRFARITVDPTVFAGKPCIRRLRFPVSRLLGPLAAGETRETILRDYPFSKPPTSKESQHGFHRCWRAPCKHTTHPSI
jgi:hypothetical protein